MVRRNVVTVQENFTFWEIGSQRLRNNTRENVGVKSSVWSISASHFSSLECRRLVVNYYHYFGGVVVAGGKSQSAGSVKSTNKCQNSVESVAKQYEVCRVCWCHRYMTSW